MKIPFLDLSRRSAELNEEIAEAFRRVAARGSFILGAEVEAFEREWARFCEAKGAVGLANGTDTITLALIASGAIRAGVRDEVITTPLTAGYTALAIAGAGAKPVFADIDEKTFNLCPEKIEAAVTPRTAAVVPVHLYGQMTDMRAVGEIARRHNLIVIEDAAQAHGARFGGKPAGREAASLASSFSFYPTKNLGAFGDGGAIVSDDENFLQKIRVLRQGGHPAAMHSGTTAAGRNSRLDEMQAAFLRVGLGRLDEWNRRRRALADIYFRKLSDFPGLKLPFVRAEAESVFHLFVVRHPQRDRLKEFLAARGVETMIHYPFLLHRQKIFRSAEQKPLPVAEKAAGEILSLPLYPQMREAEIETVCEAIAEFENQNPSILSRDANN